MQPTSIFDTNIPNNYQDRSGRKIGKYYYHPRDKIGEGQFGVVYKARDSTTKELVALKIISFKLLENEYIANLLINEVEILKKVKSSNIVKFIDVIYSKNNIYIITEFCSEGDLNDYLKKKKTLPEVEAI